MRTLLNALAPLIGAEVARGNRAVHPGWGDGATSEQIAGWRKQGVDSVLKELEDLFQDTCSEQYRILINKVNCARLADLRFR